MNHQNTWLRCPSFWWQLGVLDGVTFALVVSQSYHCHVIIDGGAVIVRMTNQLGGYG